MRVMRGAALGAATLVLGFVGPAAADSVTVEGTSESGEPTEITKMVVQNRTDEVLVKVFGTGGKNAVRWVDVDVKDGDGTRYQAMAAWYGEDWATSLAKGDDLVSCDDFVFAWIGDGGFWKVSVPRSCLDGLANRIKVRSELVASGPMPGFTGWSPWVKRG